MSAYLGAYLGWRLAVIVVCFGLLIWSSRDPVDY